MTPAGRRTAIALLAALPLLGLGLTAVVLGPHVGPTVASHWSGIDRPDGFAPTWALFGGCAAVAAVGFAIAVLGVLLQRPWSRTAALIATIVGGAIAAAWVVGAWATADAVRPEDATLGPRILIVAAPILVAAAIWRLLPPTRRSAPDRAPAPDVPPLDREERIAYSATITSRPLIAAAVVTSLVAVVGAAVLVRSPGGVAVAAVLVAAALAVVVLVPVRLTVDARGIRLTSALLQIPLIRVPIDDVAEVVAETIEPMQWGGWGYRFSGAGRAYVARRGPGIVIHRRGRGPIAITVDDAAVPAGVANALAARATG